MSDEDKPDVKGAFEAAHKGEGEAKKQSKDWSKITARTALEAAIKALDEVGKKGQLSAEGKKARDLCQKALYNVPERIKQHAPEQKLTPGGAMRSAADRVDNKIIERRDAKEAEEKPDYMKYLKSSGRDKSQDKDREK